MTPHSDPRGAQPALQAAALLLIDAGATPSELAARLQRLGAAGKEMGTAASRARLGRRGLVCLATTGGEDAPYVLPWLGREYADASLESSPELAARLEEF